MTCRIISWNIRHGGRGRASAIAAQLTAWKPDVLVLQEHRGVPEIERALVDAGLQHVLCLPSDLSPRRNRVLLASRRRMRAAPSPVTPMPERAVAARVVIGAHEVEILGLHIPNRDSGVKYEFLTAIATHCAVRRTKRMIVLGDMNSGARGLDDETLVFNRRESDWTASFSRPPWCDAYRYIHGDTRAFSWHSPNAGNGFRIDHAFVTPDLASRLKRCEYLWSIASGTHNSDHAALLVELDTGVNLAVSSARSPSKRR